MDRRTARGMAALRARREDGRPCWRRWPAVYLSIGVVVAAFFGRLIFETVFDLGGKYSQISTATSWPHPSPGLRGGGPFGLLFFELQRTGAGPLADRAEWTFTVVEGGVSLAQPDPAAITRAEAALRESLENNPTRWGERLDPRPVALDLLPRGQLTTVVIDRRARVWNIVHGAGLAVAIAAAIHLLAALAMTVHGKLHGLARGVPALSRLHAVVLLACCILLPATGVLWVFWWNMPDPWWAYTFAPLAGLAIVLLVCLPKIAARLRRASLAGDFVCTACMYDLRELPAAGNCPECGQPYERQATASAWGSMRA
ncbi:MAG: hypothetical protein HRU13_05735 [Phycisphaerales bacterium]|nr:hypothetical protein [Phycisphaerales bacterium]